MVEIQGNDQEHDLVIKSTGNRLEFQTSGMALRKFFHLAHPGGVLQSLMFQVLHTKFALDVPPACVGKVHWPENRVDESFAFWHRDVEPPPRAASYRPP